MEFAFSEEQEAFREMLRGFLAETAPSAEVRRLMESERGYDPEHWRRMSEELGLPGVAIPEAYGGQGFSFLELGIVQEELGRVLLPSPFFASACLAAPAILAVAHETQKKDLLPGIASGETLASLALYEPASGADPAQVAMEHAERDGEQRITGEKRFVVHGGVADLLLVVARQPGSRGAEGLSLLAVKADDPGVRAAPLEPLDGTRPLATLHFDGARATLLGEAGRAGPALEKLLHMANAALACEMSGGAQRCLEMAVEYSKVRVQFGKPIGSFQAIKHRCAEMLLEIECARVAATYASWVAAEDGDDLPRAASLAKAYCGDAFLAAAEGNLQIHGGIGFTWEADPQLFLKRAQSAAILLGDPTDHRVKLADLLGF